MFGNLQQSLDRIEQQQEKIMASIATIQAAQLQEKTDLATLATLVPQLLAAFASGAMTPAQAQAVLNEVNSEDSTIQSISASVSAALPPAPVPTQAPTSNVAKG
jgi:fructose-bisphosphate aldolase class 1